MNLEEQISEITNPQEFTRLCNTILTAEYGADFQVIDGTRGDEGNDGYVISERRIIAIYCPIKPERKTDVDYIEKIRKDIEKTKALRDSGKYDVLKWTFMTPRKLSSKVIAIMLREANGLEIDANHQEATYLANALYKYKHLLQAFPDLFLLDINEKLDEVITLLRDIRKENIPKETEIDKDGVYKGRSSSVDELDRVRELRKKPRNGEVKVDLKTIYYKTADPVIKLNALFGILELFDPVSDAAGDMIHLCEEGILISQREGASSVRAYLLAQKGYLLSFIYSNLDMQTAFQIMADNAIGFPTISEEYRQTVIQKLSGLEREYTKTFNEAIDLVKQTYDLKMLGAILIFVGNAAGQRASYLSSLNVKHRAMSEKQKCKRALLTAKDIYDHMKDELNATNALFNLANQIRFFGEEREALELTKTTIQIAKKYNDGRLLQRAEWLKETLETGRIPNYVAGEGRE